MTSVEAASYSLPEAELERLSSPALVIHLDRVRSNIRAMLRYCDGDADRWRPHLKTTKIPEIWRELVAAGVSAFKCATTREAAVMLDVLRASEVTRADLLVAYPHVGPARQRLAALARANPKVRLSLLCEEPDDVAAIPGELDLFVDVNPGMDRTGMAAGDAPRLVEIARRAGPRFRGIHFYDGHLHDIDYAVRRAKAHACYDTLMELVARLAGMGVAVGEIITSGTPAFRAALDYPRFRTGAPKHRISPGTVVFHDQRSIDEIPELALEPAALVLTRVVSWPGPARVTCDAGSKSLAAESGDPCAAVLGHPELVARTPSEEHLPLDVLSGPRPARGAPLLLVPRHVCPTINLAEEALLVDAGRVIGVVRVAARAHDLRF